MTLFSIERFVAVYYPMDLKRFLRKKRTITVIILLGIIASVFYLFILVTKELLYSDFHHKGYYCGVKHESIYMTFTFIRIDTIVSVIVPFVVISVMNILIIYRLKKNPIRKCYKEETIAIKQNINSD